MTSGRKTRPLRSDAARGWRAACAAAALLLGAETALAFDIAELMGLLARQPHGEARFTEQRFVQGLDGAPAVSSGTLSHAPPDRLARRTLAPRAEAFVVEGNTVTMSRGGRSRSVALDSAPELVALVEALRGTLSGNAASLQRHFRTALSGSADAWTLELVPIDAQLAQQVQRLRIAGSGGDLRTVEMLFRSGDRSLTTIEPLRAGERAAAVEPASAPAAAAPASRP